MTSRYSPAPSVDRRTGTALRALSVVAVLATVSIGLAQPEPVAPEGGAPAPAATTSSPEAAALLKQAREKLGSYRTLRAKMNESVAFGPRRFKAVGSYLQGPDNRVRVDLAVAIGDNKGRLLQVSEGDVLWTVYDVGARPRITRRDVKQILSAVSNEGNKARHLAELGLGGVPALLASIEQSIAFDAPLEAEIEGRKFHVLKGEWKDEIRAAFEQQLQQIQPQQVEQARKLGVQIPLPPHIPELVRVYLDAETLFPYRIRYLKRGATPGAEPTPLLTLDFRDIVVNASLDPSEFRYTPPSGVEVADVTSYYLQQIRTGAALPAGQVGSAPPRGATEARQPTPPTSP